MAIRNIMLDSDPVLRKESKPVNNFDENLCELLDDMYETMLKNNGSGIAAPQVGVLRRAIIVEINGVKLEFVNPTILKKSGSWSVIEGCLSVQNRNGYVTRPYEITVKAFDRFKNPFTITACDWLSRAILHEVDHLNGVLFTDIMSKECVKNDKKNKK